MYETELVGDISHSLTYVSGCIPQNFIQVEFYVSRNFLKFNSIKSFILCAGNITKFCFKMYNKIMELRYVIFLYQLVNIYVKSGSDCTVCAFASLSGILGNFRMS